MLFLDIFNCVRNYQYNSQLSSEQIKIAQQRSFLKLLLYVQEKSPYYRKIIREYNINITNCTPESFPILTKEEAMENFNEIVTDPDITKVGISSFLNNSKDPNDLYLKKYYVLHTSGSSGTVGNYIFSKKELTRGLVPALAFMRGKPFEKLAYIAAVNGHFAGVTMAKFMQTIPFFFQTVQGFDINLPLETIISKLNEMKPTRLGGYVYGLKKIAEAQMQGKLSLHLNMVITGGEPLTNEDQQFLETVFHCPVLNIYAASEHLVMGLSKKSFEGIYLMEENLIFEISPRFTNVTNLYNYTFPLIRYRMSDILKPIIDEQQTMHYTKIASIIGREEDVPIFFNDKGQEDFISPLILDDLLISHVEKFQMHIIDTHRFIIKVVLEKGLDTETIKQTKENLDKKIQQILKEKLMTNVLYIIEEVDNLPINSKTGKFKLVVQD